MIMGKIRIGTRESQLAIWQATHVKELLAQYDVESELVFIKSEGDVDTVTPLYAIGVIGIFTKTLDAALLNNRIDIAVHSMKDVPVQLAQGIKQAAVLKRGSHKDIFVPHPEAPFRLSPKGKATHTQNLKFEETNLENSLSLNEALKQGQALPLGGLGWAIATSSIRRIAQWLRRYPHHKIENLRGNVNTRLRKLKESNWNGAIFAAAGLERINLRPENAIDLDWMLPAPAQGAIMIVCRENDNNAFASCQSLNDDETALCTKIERDFLSGLMGGCSTPISALAEVKDGEVHFKGNIVTPDGKLMTESHAVSRLSDAADLGQTAAEKILTNGGQPIIDQIRNATI